MQQGTTVVVVVVDVPEPRFGHWLDWVHGIGWDWVGQTQTTVDNAEQSCRRAEGRRYRAEHVLLEYWM